MKIINLTPHNVVLNDGSVFPPSGKIARVAARHTNVGWLSAGPDGTVEMGDEFFESSTPLYCIEYSGVEGMPEPAEAGTWYIVSSIVLQAAAGRTDLIAPATGHPDTVRDNQGRIVSVPGFIRG